MSINAFKFPDGPNFIGNIFLDSFLRSPDFDMHALKRIAKTLDIQVSKMSRKEDIVNPIILVADAERQNTKYKRLVIAKELIDRNREWIAFKTGKVKSFPKCADPLELLVGPGSRQWYGPLESPNVDGSVWYIRPEFFEHWELQTDKQPEKQIIRWLCFARMTSEMVSLHWRGFTHADEEQIAVEQHSNKVLRAWDYIPQFFDELSQLANLKLKEVNLHKLILHTLWDIYRHDKDGYSWNDLRIRAQSGGVALSARAGFHEDIDINGIKHLASTIRNSIDAELSILQEARLPNSDHFEEVILRTLIQEFGALSYEFSLDNSKGEKIYKAHSYFGAKNVPSHDKFPHLRIYIGTKSDLEQLEFLVKHLNERD